MVIKYESEINDLTLRAKIPHATVEEIKNMFIHVYKLGYLQAKDETLGKRN